MCPLNTVCQLTDTRIFATPIRHNIIFQQWYVNEYLCEADADAEGSTFASLCIVVIKNDYVSVHTFLKCFAAQRLGFMIFTSHKKEREYWLSSQGSSHRERLV